MPKSYLEKHTAGPHLKNFDEYQKLYDESIRDPDTFWARMARELLTFDKDFTATHSGTFEDGDNAWFIGGRLNASFNCVDRHALKDPNKVAIIYEADEPGQGRNITYGELRREVSRMAWVLKQQGVKKGETVAVYLPMIPEAIVTFLAIARIGAVHSVVFAGFSSDSLRDRVIDAQSKVVITTDEGKRGGKLIGTKKIVDEALKQCPDVHTCIVHKRTGADVPWTKGRDLWWHEEVEKYPSYIAPEPVDSEDPLFLLYTSGSTGKPKGVMHTTAGYLVGAALSGKYVFDIHDSDRFFCGGDVGWVTGHTYVVYAPLLLGCATVVFESTPAYPNFSRYWDVIEKHSVTQFYVAPTALRLLKRAGDEHIRHEMKHLRTLGTVGEPIAAEVWKWYFETVGKQSAQIIDVRRTRPTNYLCASIVSVCVCVSANKSFSYNRPTGRRKLAPTSSPRSQESPRRNLVVLPCPSSVSSPPLSTPSRAKNSRAMMLKAFSPSRSRSQAWPALCGARTRDIWILISMSTRATT